MFQLKAKIVLLGFRPHLDLLNLDDNLLFFRIMLLLADLILVLAVVHDATDGGIRLGTDFDKIETSLCRQFDGFLCCDNSVLFSILIDDPDDGCRYVSVYARSNLLLGNRSSTFRRGYIFSPEGVGDVGADGIEPSTTTVSR